MKIFTIFQNIPGAKGCVSLPGKGWHPRIQQGCYIFAYGRSVLLVFVAQTRSKSPMWQMDKAVPSAAGTYNLGNTAISRSFLISNHLFCSEGSVRNFLSAQLCSVALPIPSLCGASGISLDVASLRVVPGSFAMPLPISSSLASRCLSLLPPCTGKPGE